MGDVFLARFYAWILEDLGLSVKKGFLLCLQGLQPQKIYGHAGGDRDQKDSQPEVIQNSENRMADCSP
jgi:hypothetical protein